MNSLGIATARTGIKVLSGGINAVGVVTATGGFNLGIGSAGTSITDGPVKRLNFIGTGNTFLYDASSDIVDISIAGGGGASVTVSDDAPSSPSDGDLWFESDTADLKVYYNDGSSAQWVSASGGDSAVITSTSAPSSAQDGDLWYDSENGNLFVYYDDGDGAAQWVAANNADHKVLKVFRVLLDLQVPPVHWSNRSNR